MGTLMRRRRREVFRSQTLIACGCAAASSMPPSARRRSGASWCRRLRQSEVENLDAAVLGQEEVLGLQIAMNDPPGMRRGEARCDLRRVLDGLARRHRPAVQPRAERLPFEELHHDIHDGRNRRGRGSVRADVVDGDDAGRVEGGCGSRLPLQPRHALRITCEQRGQHLDRDVAVQPRIARFVDFAHPAGSEVPEDFVRTETGAGLKGHAVGGLYPVRLETTQARCRVKRTFPDCFETCSARNRRETSERHSTGRRCT